MPYCRECGAEIGEDVLFCDKCGDEISEKQYCKECGVHISPEQSEKAKGMCGRCLKDKVAAEHPGQIMIFLVWAFFLIIAPGILVISMAVYPFGIFASSPFMIPTAVIGVSMLVLGIVLLVIFTRKIIRKRRRRALLLAGSE